MSKSKVERGAVPEPEVVAVGRRRQFSVEYKRRILEEADACSKPGDVGALLRREALYSSNLVRWRRARARGELDGVRSQGGGGAGLREEVARLRREKEGLEARLAQAQAIIEVQKKLSELLGVTPEKGEAR